MIKKRFDVTVNDNVTDFLGCEVVRRDGTCQVTQRRFCRKMLERFNMQNCKGVETPGTTDLKLTRGMSEDKGPENEREWIPLYAAMIGSLIWACGTRPDISMAVGKVARFMKDPGYQHYQAVKRLFRYLKQTDGCCLTYHAKASDQMYCYVDSSFADDMETMRSTSGWIVMWKGAGISFKSRLQKLISTSTQYAEYVAASECSREVMYLRMLLAELGFPQLEATIMYEDNEACIGLTKDPVNHSMSRHISIRFHYVREQCKAENIKMIYLQTKQQVADLLTKYLPRQATELFRRIMLGSKIHNWLKQL